jgi:hypothetical protein
MFVTVGPLYETGEKMESDSESIISHNKRWEGRRYKDVYIKLLKSGQWEV